ncbi:putative protein kinase RLK-Pelle-L-LEC family [Helianthus annuus]|nr:putative protein kinase RLK-Pelle-L-LEC family [Helianthus annuus]KAJ0845720.1 putative protein kinase RLK-Pelle-L-LEC family [Helianthus annuus]
MAILKFLFLIIIPCATSLTFNFTNFSRNSDYISLSGGASISAGEIQLTSENRSYERSAGRAAFGLPGFQGRATYMGPLRLWDKTTRDLANFSTSFSFVIDSNGSAAIGVPSRSDGLMFFLAQNNSVMIDGAAMGLPFNTTSNISITPFVAVEFDTFGDDGWDNTSVGDHVGININSLTSVRYQQWMTDKPNEREYQAWIQYDSGLKNLTVSFTGFQNNTVVREDGLRYTINLMDVLPDQVIVGFSAASSLQKHNIKSWMFNSSEFDGVSSFPPHEAPNTSGIFVGLAVGLGLALITFMAILAFILRRRKKINEFEEESELAVEMNNEFEMRAAGPRKFSYLELGRSTAGFAEEGMLGQGGFGGVYKGFLEDQNTYVAVKRVSKTSRQGIKEYASEVRVISRLRHRNLVQLIGWCHEKGELLLVYEYMENGSLDFHLFKEKSLLTWGTRYKIAIGLASALFYLHEEWEQCVLHRDIKSSNVMLDSNFNVKLGDFGLAKLVDHEKGSQTTTRLAGTFGYMAPEYLLTGKASKESDVFSFGVVALEIACGRKPIVDEAQDNQIRLIDWVWDLFGSGILLEAVDSRLKLAFEEEQIKRLMIVGLWCVHPDSGLRPTMRHAIQVLKYEAPLPVLPSKMPVASYVTLPKVSNSDLSRPSTSATYLTPPSVSNADF